MHSYYTKNIISMMKQKQYSYQHIASDTHFQ